VIIKAIYLFPELAIYYLNKLKKLLRRVLIIIIIITRVIKEYQKMKYLIALYVFKLWKKKLFNSK